MRRTRYTWLAVLLAFGLLAAACGGDDESTEESETTATTEAAETTATTEAAETTTTTQADETEEMEPLEIYFIGATSSQSFSIEQGMGAEQAAEAYDDVTVTVLAPADPGDFATQVQLFNDALLEEPDGIVLFTLAPDQFVRPLADADDAGIAVIAADVPLEGYSTVTNDNVGMGSRLAEYVLQDIPEDETGTVVLGITNPGLPVLEWRAEGITAWVNENRPGLEVIGPFETTTDPTQNTQIWTDLVASNPDGVAFLGMGDQDAASLAQVRRSTSGTWANAGFDLNDTALEAIGAGDLTAVGDPQHFLKGYVGVALLVEHLRNGAELPPPAYEGLLITLDNVVTQENVDGIIERQTSPAARTDWYANQISDILANPLIVQP